MKDKELTVKIISVLIIIIPVLVFGVLNRPVLMGVYLLAGFTCAVILNFDRFESFKAGALEGKLRQVISEANATIEQLKQINEPQIQYILSHIINFNKKNGVNAKDKEAILLNLESNARTFEINDSKTIALFKEAKYEIARNYLVEIYDECKHVLGSETLGSWKFDLLLAIRDKKIPNKEEIRKIFNRHDQHEIEERNPQDVINDAVRDRIDEYIRFYNQHLSGGS